MNADLTLASDATGCHQEFGADTFLSKSAITCGKVIHVGAEPGNLYDAKDSFIEIDATSPEVSTLSRGRRR